MNIKRGKPHEVPNASDKNQRHSENKVVSTTHPTSKHLVVFDLICVPEEQTHVTGDDGLEIKLDHRFVAIRLDGIVLPIVVKNLAIDAMQLKVRIAAA